MFKFLRRHKTFVMAFVAAVFVAMLFFGINPMLAPSPQDVYFKVNGEKVTARDFETVYQQILRQQKDLNEDQKRQLRQEVIQELIRREIFSQEAEKYGIHVPDQELQRMILSMPAFQVDGQFSVEAYGRTLTQVLGQKPEEFEEARRKDLMAQKLQQLIASSVHVTEAEVKTRLPQRLAIEEDKKRRAQIKENPNIFRQELKQREANRVFSDWLAQINRTLKFEPVSDEFQKMMQGG